jgi:hypothetical protein
MRTLVSIESGDTRRQSGGCLVCLTCTPPRGTWVGRESHVDFGRDVAKHLLAPPAGPEDPTLSRRHARLVVDDGGAILTDLGSTNGTWLRGHRLDPHVPARLASGAVFEVGAGRYAWLDDRLVSWSSGAPAAWLDDAPFVQACLAAIRRAERDVQPLALAVIECLCDERDIVDCLPRVSSRVLRRGDVLGRLGSREWALLLPDTEAHLAQTVVGCLRCELPPVHAGLVTLAFDWSWTFRFVGAPALDLDSVRLLLGAARDARDTGSAFSQRAIDGLGVLTRPKLDMRK